MNFATFVEVNGRTYGELPAIAHGARVHLTYRQWAARCRRLAGHLAGRLDRGARVAIVMANHPGVLETLFAVWHAGLVAVPINPRLHPNEIAFVLANSGASLAVTDSHFSSALSRLVEVLEVGSADWERASAGPETGLVELPPDSPAWLFYTSGTTGRPKGATITHRNLLAMTLAYYADIERVGPGQCALHPASMTHGSGLYSLPFAAKGALNVIPESGGFSPTEIVSLLRSHEAVSFFAAPVVVRRLVDNAAFVDIGRQKLRTIVYGGAPMNPGDLRRAIELLGDGRLAQIFGQGESPMTITGLGKRHHTTGDPVSLRRLGSVGVPRTGIELRIVDDNGHKLPPGEAGEIVCRGDSVMSGYWADEEATAGTLRGGWLHTGDIGVVDDDGFLFLRDRLKDVIISAGSNIYPREVEDVLLRHPGVREVSVVGRDHPSRGEEVVAFVVAGEGNLVTRPELDALCLSAVARYKKPRAYYFVDELPKNENGKVLKTALRARLNEGAAG